jgi:hypothetical protein
MAISNQKLSDRVLKSKIENPLYKKDHERRIKTIIRSINLALNAVDRVFESRQKSQFWYQNSGIAILLALIGKIAARCGHAPSQGEFRKYFKALVGHFAQYRSIDRIKSLRQRCNSEGGREEVISEFARIISKVLNDESFGDGLPEDKFEKRIKRVERSLAHLVAKVLTVESNDWTTQRVQPDIKKRAMERMQKEQNPDMPIQDFLTFGETIAIIKRADNLELFKPYFLFRNGFANLNQFEAGCQTLNDLRGRTAHGRGKFSDSDEFLLDGYLQKFESFLKIYDD